MCLKHSNVTLEIACVKQLTSHIIDSMYSVSMHFPLRSTLRFILLLLVVSELRSVSAQNFTTQSPGSVSRLQCPSGFHCFDNSSKTVVIGWGHNGHICGGQSPEQCYGESDPLGFVRGPRQHPQTVVHGDKVLFKPMSITFNARNVSKAAYDNCIQSGQLVHNETTSNSFEVPSEYLNPPGIKYFISNDLVLYSCRFGIKLELYVRSRLQPNCINPATPHLGVCSGVGVCASDASTFFTRNYSCLCIDAYHGKYCEELDSCDSSRNPCKNGATCKDITNGITDSFNCTCPPGYDGILCGNNIDECASDPCQNGGFCVDYVNSYSCFCQPDFECDNCECIIPDSCASEPCKNGGTCQRTGEKRKNYTCTCPPNFTGRNCTENITSSSLSAQTSMLLSTSLVINSSSTSLGFSSSSSFATRGLTSSVPTTQVRTFSSQLLLTPTTLQRSPSTSRSMQQSILASTTAHLVSTYTTTEELPTTSLSVQTTVTSSVQVVSSLVADSSLPPSTSVRSIFSPSFSSFTEDHRSSSSVPRTASSAMRSLVSSQTLTATLSSFYVTNTSSALPSSSLLILSSSLAAPVTSTVTVRQTSPTSSRLPLSSTALTSLAFTSSAPSAMVTESSLSTSKTAVSTVSTIFYSSSLTVSPLQTSPLSAMATESSSSTRKTAVTTVSTILYSSLLTVFPSRTSVLIDSTVVPTSTPSPSTPSLRNQTCINNPCNNGTCFNEPYLGFKFRCECPYPTVGPLCTSIKEGGNLHFPAFRRNSYLEHKSISFNSELNTIDITFQTNASDGLLLFAADHKRRGDFIQLHVVGGKLEFRFDPGDSVEFIQSNESVNTGQIITATARYVRTSDPPFGTLQVDNGVELKQEVQGRLKGIQLYDSWFIGGVPPGLSMRNKTNRNAAPSPSFVGSIRDVQINGEAITLGDAEGWFNINEGDLPACQNMPCQNNGVCVPHDDNVHDYTCNCTAGFTGRNCESHVRCLSENCNGGECIPKDSNPLDFICLCPFGRVGVQCETIIDITVPLFTIVQNVPSFLEYQVPRDAVNSFHVTFQFRLDNSSTSWNDSLMVYSAQNKFQGSGDDFFAIGIKNNRVLLQFYLGSGIARIYSEPLSRSEEWHLVVAGREGRDGYLYVDDQPRKQATSPGPLIGLNLFEPLYIGGMPDTRQLPSVVDFKSGGFHGSIYDVAIRFSLKSPFIQLTTSTSVEDASKEWVVVKGRNVGNESYDECISRTPPCANGGNCTREGATYLCSCPANWAGLYCTSQRVPCYGYNNPCVAGTCRPDGSTIRCDCPLGKTGQLCEQDVTIQTPLFQNFSYMLFQSTNIRRTTQISIRFKPATLSGILFYVGYVDQSNTGDYLSIFLHDGLVKLRYNLGKGSREAKSNSTVSLNTWYTVGVSRTEKNATLTVSGDTPVSVISPGSAIALDVPSNFYLGGVRKLSAINPNAVAASVQDFSGCIERFEVNGILYLQTNTGALEGRNIDNCPASSQA